MNLEEKKEKMKQIRDDVINLKESPLYEYRIKNGYLPVIGQGSHDANILFIGEAPGEKEAKTGVPFCGASGKFLDELLEHIKLPREEVYIANILKDRPQANRDPRPEEIELYVPFLDRQIEIIEPKVIATLGRFSMDYIMKRYGLGDKITKISDMHGQVFKTKGPAGDVTIVPLYHPAVAIYNANNKDELKKDFEVLKDIIS
jgi:uracil-DNA glycosylase